jgi:hypothetical protein
MLRKWNQTKGLYTKLQFTLWCHKPEDHDLKLLSIAYHNFYITGNCKLVQLLKQFAVILQQLRISNQNVKVNLFTVLALMRDTFNIFLVNSERVKGLVNRIQEIKCKQCTYTYLQLQQMVYQFDQVKDEIHQLQQSLQDVLGMVAWQQRNAVSPLLYKIIQDLTINQ